MSRKCTAMRFGATLLIGLFLLAGCTRTPEVSQAAPAPNAVATIKAEPNPAPVADGKFGKTTITWDTGDGTAGDVMLSHEGGAEKPFAKNRIKGSQEATWIGKGVYEFRLYAGTDRGKPRASVQVTRAQK